MPKPKIEIDVKKCEALAQRGLTDEAIASAMGFSSKTLQRRKKEMSELSAALSRARARAEGSVADRLVSLMNDPDIPARVQLDAVKFWLERRAGWTLAAMDKKLMGDALTHEVPVINVQIDAPNEHTPAWAELREQWRREWEQERQELAEKQEVDV